MEIKKRRFLILDANIPIDLFQCDKTIIKLIDAHIGRIHLATPILSEVKEIDENECIEPGIRLVEPELMQVMLAAKKKGSLSFIDNICLILAKEHGLTCVT